MKMAFRDNIYFEVSMGIKLLNPCEEEEEEEGDVLFI
jgi:hypothetical protein